MAIRLVAILLVLLVCRYVPDAVRLRNFDWWQSWIERVGASQPAAVFVLGVGLPVLVCALLQWGVRGDWFGFSTFLLSAAMLYYCWGPRDLERDVEAIEKAPDSDRRAAAAQALRAPGSDATIAFEAQPLVAATFEAALKRWFGVLFWFVMLGPVGAFGYRLVQLCTFIPTASAVRDPARRFALMLDWIPAHLVALALAVASNFDAVFKTWRDWHVAQGDRFELNPGFLDAIARASVDADVAADDDEFAHADPHAPMVALSDAMVLVRRVMIVWLTIVALVVIGGWWG